MRTGRILVVDDEVHARNALRELLRDEGFDVEMAADAFTALATYEAFAPHVVLTDLKMPGMDGIELVKRLRAREEPSDVIVITALGAVETAVEAMRAGASNYLTKPLNFDELLVVLDKVLEMSRLRRETRQLRARVRDRFSPRKIIGDGPAMQRVFEVIDQVAPSKASILISGESGTGKELIANVIHQRSPRANAPFIKLHCAAQAESLLESELFGLEQGAFTRAEGGTLFLDEIGEISPTIQIELLRFIEEQNVDVRVIAASTKNLKEEGARGKFREDLYYRLSVVALEIPPLRTRKSDISALARLFVERYAKENGKSIDGIAPEAMQLLVTYDWPGNVRELENAIERAVVLAGGNVLEARALPSSVRPSHMPAGAPAIPGAKMAELERYAILETLKATNGSTSKAAEILGISTRTIQYRLHEYNLARRPDVSVVAKSANSNKS